MTVWISNVGVRQWGKTDEQLAARAMSHLQVETSINCVICEPLQQFEFTVARSIVNEDIRERMLAFATALSYLISHVPPRSDCPRPVQTDRVNSIEVVTCIVKDPEHHIWIGGYGSQPGFVGLDIHGENFLPQSMFSNHLGGLFEKPFQCVITFSLSYGDSEDRNHLPKSAPLPLNMQDDYNPGPSEVPFNQSLGRELVHFLHGCLKDAAGSDIGNYESGYFLISLFPEDDEFNLACDFND
ncbi:hypothetical protein ACTXT7_003581 [Hymenolepis weldensis]